MPHFSINFYTMSTEIILEKKKLSSEKIMAPKKYAVIFLNDNHTPMEFVVAVLMKVFKHSEAKSKELMMQIHTEGKSTVAIYSYEIAEQKSIDTIDLARANGWPLKVRVEEA